MNYRGTGLDAEKPGRVSRAEVSKLSAEQVTLGRWDLLLEGEGSMHFMVILFIVIIIFLLFRAVSTACGGSQARGLIRATTGSLHHSHSNEGSESHLRPTAHDNARSLTH